MIDPTIFQAALSADPAIPGDPFTRLRYQYGMLLGAEDFSVEQRESVLRRRLHQALLHGSGTVWGLRVCLGQEHEGVRTQVIVQPGLAVDALGRDIYVDQAQCIDVSGLPQNPIWGTLEAPETAPASTPPPPDGASSNPTYAAPSSASPRTVTSASTVRRVYVVLRHVTCHSQPVPAITAPCNEPGDAAAYSRVLDRFSIDLAAEAPPAPHALQRDWLAALLAAGPGASPRDVLVDFLLGPCDKPTKAPTSPCDRSAKGPLPPLALFWQKQIDAPLLLATLDLEVTGTGAQATAHVVPTAGNPDNAVRALLPPVQLVAESLFGERLLGAPLPTASTAAPFQVLGWKVVHAKELRVRLSAKPHSNVLASKPLQLFRLETKGWKDFTSRVTAVSFDEKAGEIVLTLDQALDKDLGVQPVTYQIRIAGDATTPLVAEDGSPLAGIAGDPLTRHGQGRDVNIIDTWKA